MPAVSHQLQQEEAPWMQENLTEAEDSTKHRYLNANRKEQIMGMFEDVSVLTDSLNNIVSSAGGMKEMISYSRGA